MSAYELIINTIRLAPILIMVLVALSLTKKRTAIRVPVIFIAGWIAIVTFTFGYWHYAIEFAPSAETRHELALKDGGAKTGSLMFGWVYSLIFVFLYEAARVSIRKAGSILRKKLSDYVG
jgi:hypothetical protein